MIMICLYCPTLIYWHIWGMIIRKVDNDAPIFQYTQILRPHKFRTLTLTFKIKKNIGSIWWYHNNQKPSLSSQVKWSRSIQHPTLTGKYMVTTVSPVLFCSGRSLGSWKENVCGETLWLLWQEISSLIGKYCNTFSFAADDRDKQRGCPSPNVGAAVSG